MSSRIGRLVTGMLALALLVACGGSSSGSSSGPAEARVTIQAQFQKVPVTPGGPGPVVLKQARYCWAELREAGSNTLLASGYLGSDGTGSTYVPLGLSVYAQVYAQYQVPSADPNSFFLRGSVKNAPLPVSYLDYQAFSAIPVWNVVSAAVRVDHDGTLGVTALTGNRAAGAFNIADQAVTFGAAVRDMDGSTTLRLPNLHTFWTTSLNAADQYRDYPSLTYSSSTSYLISDAGRALFSHQVFGQGSGTAGTETDEWDDGVLQETFARLLFADRSFKADGSSPLSLLRRDNDNVWVDRDFQSESTAAFVAGFSDFLAGAVRNDSRILDTYVDGSGLARVAAFDLTDHAYVPGATKGEFARGSIAISLWGIWKNALGGGQAGLGTLWAAVRSPTAYLDGTGEYEQATLGCFPTYLQGVANRVNGATWSDVLGQLALESVPNPDPGYFAGPALWLDCAVGATKAGTLQTYAASANIYYDRNQSQAWRFAHGGGARTISMSPTGTQDFWLELIGPGGWVAGSTDLPGVRTRTLTVPNLPAGVYVARVRAGYTTATGTYGYTISVN